MISVVILADIRLYREGLADVLHRHHSIRVVGTASGNREGVACVRDAVPDVALVDMAMLDSASVVRSLAETAPTVKVLALAVPETESHVLACAEAGIAGYVPREGTLDDLIAALHGVARGEAFCSPRIVAVLLRRIADLSIEVATVKNHVHNILENLQIRRRYDAAARIRSHRRLRGVELDGLDHPV